MYALLPFFPHSACVLALLLVGQYGVLALTRTQRLGHEPKVTFVYVSIFSWVTFGILLDFTVAITVHFHPPLYKVGGGEASLSRLLIVAKV